MKNAQQISQSTKLKLPSYADIVRGNSSVKIPVQHEKVDTKMPVSSISSSSNSNDLISLSEPTIQCSKSVLVCSETSKQVKQLPNESQPSDPLLSSLTSSQAQSLSRATDASEVQSLQSKGLRDEFQSQISTGRFNQLNHEESIEDQSQAQSKADAKRRVDVNELSSEQSGPKFSVQIEIFGHTLQCLIDSGSQVNVLPITSLPEDFDKSMLGRSFLDLRAYNETRIPVIGTFITDVLIGEITTPVCFHVVENTTFAAILGTPFLKEAEINFKLGTLTIKSSQIMLNNYKAKDGDVFNIKMEAKKTPVKVCLAAHADTIIEGLSEAVISVKCTSEIEGEALYATCPQSCRIQNLIAAKSASFISADDLRCNIRLINTSANATTLRANETFIQAERVNAIALNQKPLAFEEIKKEIRIETKDEKVRADILKLVKTYSDVFATSTEPAGRTNAMDFTINTGDSEPISQQRYRTPYFLRGEMKKIINENVRKGLLAPISSPWAAPTLLVKKPDGNYRLVCDYRRLNAVTAPEHYPLPFIGDLIDNLAESKIFSVMDLAAGFHQIPCSKEAKEKLAISTEFGQFSWNVMPMGLRNAPSVFQRLMDNIFRHMPSSSLVIYLDDILVHAKESASHLKQLEEVFSTLRKNGLKLKPSKTVLATDEANFCGFIIRNGFKHKNARKVQAVAELKAPKTRVEAQSVFGLLNFHRIFIKDFATIAHPIVRSYSTKTPFVWSAEANRAFETLKKLICDAALTLVIPNPHESLFVLETDASEHGFGASLMICTKKDEHEDHDSTCLRPIEYLSSQFTEAQKKMYIAEKELFCGKFAMQKWSHYLLGRDFIWFTDNSVFRWATRVRSTNQKINKWLAEISEFQFTSILRPTNKMKISDCLSRTINSITIQPNELTSLQDNDSTLKMVRNYVRSDRWPLHPTSCVQFYKLRRSKLKFGGNQELIFKNEDGPKFVAPKSISQDILKTHHDEAGHPGIEQTKRSIADAYLWENLDNDVRRYVQSCQACQRQKANTHPNIPSQGLSSTPKTPYEAISFDLIGPLGITRSNNRYILVGVDQFSKKIYTAALASKMSSEVTAAIQNIIFLAPKMPCQILTDNGLEFSEVSAICDLIGAKHRKSPAYRPQTNGLCERSNQTLKNRLFIGQQDPDWDKRLAFTTHQINTSINSSTGFSPFEIETGFKGNNVNDHLATDTRQSNPKQNQGTARKRIKKEKEERYRKFQRPNFTPFEVGAHVLIKNKLKKHPKYLGPYCVKVVKGEGTSYILECLETERLVTRHASELKHFIERQISDENSSIQAHSDQSEELVHQELPEGHEIDDSDSDYFIPTRFVSANAQTFQNRSGTHEEKVQSHFFNQDLDIDQSEVLNVSKDRVHEATVSNMHNVTDSAKMENVNGVKKTTDAREDTDVDDDIYSQDSLLPSSTVDCWIDEGFRLSQQSEDDRAQADANLRDIQSFLNDIIVDDITADDITAASNASFDDLIIASHQEVDKTQNETTTDSITTAGETDYETAGEDSHFETPDKEEMNHYALRDRNTLRKPKRLIESDSDIEEATENEKLVSPRKKSDASLISVVAVQAVPNEDRQKGTDESENEESNGSSPSTENQTCLVLADRNIEDSEDQGDCVETDASADEEAKNNRWSGISITLEEMEKRQLKQIASKNEIPIPSSKPELRKAIEKLFEERYPDWRRNSSNQLVFKRKLEIDKPTPIATLSKKELRTLALYFGKDHICDKAGFKFKAEWRNALNSHLRELFPTAKLDRNNYIILTPSMFGQQ